jgi:Mu-like prophage major head subunit gpT
MSDGFALFSPEHGNLLPPGALTLPTLSAARQAMRTQRSAEGTALSIEPIFLVVGPALEVAALQILNGTFVPPTVEATIPAPMRTLQLVVDARIDDASWYLAASPNQIDTLEYAYLDGAPEGGPALESQPGWNVDGIQLKARMAFGAAAIDFRGLNKTPA